MLLVLSKLLAVVIDPAGLALILFIAGSALAFVPRRAKLSATFIVCGMLTLLIFSSPLTAHFLMRGLEGQYQPQTQYPNDADAVVLLGGFTIGKIPPRAYVETNHRADRIFHAVRVWRGSGAPKLILAGGLTEFMSEEKIPEAESMLELLTEFFGVDTSGIMMESASRNTRENAANIKTLMDEAEMGGNIILVTSAFHMPRSVAIFKKAGFATVTPAPTDYVKNDFISLKPMTWMPSSCALLDSSTAIKEYIGMVLYKIMGWM
jgi:uncharacterized SAM-binding protein YcdF (DUF218 family)